MRTCNLAIYLVACSLSAPASCQNATGTLQFFRSDDCTDPTSDKIAAAGNQCIEGNSSAAVAAFTFALCENGQPASLQASDKSGCLKPSIWPLSTDFGVGECLFYSTGTNINSAAFVCNDTAEGQPAAPAASTASDASQLPQNTAGSQSSADSGGGVSGAGQTAVEAIVGVVAIIVAVVGIRYARRAWKSQERVEYGEPPPPYRRRR